MLSHLSAHSPEITGLSKAGAPSVRVWRPRLPLLLHMLLCVSALGFPFGFLVYHTEQSHRLREE